MVLREILRAHIPTLSEESTLQDAIDKMEIYQFPALVFVDPIGLPLAVITEGDICRAVSASDSLVTIATHLAMAYATKSPFTSSPDAEIGSALHEMLMRGISILPVIEANTLYGVVLRVDLMHAILIDASETK